MHDVQPRTASVREVTFALFRELGVSTVFGNPGSTELRFLKNWPDDFTYVMGLHEGCVVAMADVFAQATGKPAFANLHSAGGVGNAMGTIFTAFRNRAPVVILAGQQTRAMLRDEPFLFAEDATTLPRPYVKWAIEPARAEDVPAAIAHAYYVAMQRPCGPTFVSIPEDDWERTTTFVDVRRIDDDAVASDGVLRALADALDGARAPAFVVGAGADRADAAPALVALAERTRATVFASALTGRCGFPEDHAQFAGALPRIRTGVVERLAPHDLVLVVGAPVFNFHIHAEGPYVGETTTVVHITDDPSAAAAAVVGDSIVGSIRRTVERLGELTAQSTRRSAAPPRAALAATMELTTAGVFAAVRGTLPADAIIVEETPSLHTRLHDVGLLRPGRYFSAASGSLGFGLPGAAGAAFAAPGKRILALIGDGSAHYGIQGIWTAVEHHLPITFLIVNNAGYDAMNAFSKLMQADRSPSFAIRNVDFAALAAGYGCRAEIATTESELAAALGRSYASQGPTLIDARVVSASAALF
jgi:benzoylformate decarboxylase